MLIKILYNLYKIDGCLMETTKKISIYVSVKNQIDFFSTYQKTYYQKFNWNGLENFVKFYIKWLLDVLLIGEN